MEATELSIGTRDDEDEAYAHGLRKAEKSPFKSLFFSDYYSEQAINE